MTDLRDVPSADLPPMDFWKARSFWLTLVAAASSVSIALGFDLFGFLGVENGEALTDAIMPIVAGISAVLAWRERLRPKVRLVTSGGVVK